MLSKMTFINNLRVSANGIHFKDAKKVSTIDVANYQSQ
jgi:hypothetical protein